MTGPAARPPAVGEWECCRRATRELEQQLAVSRAEAAHWRTAFYAVVVVAIVGWPVVALNVVMQWDVQERLIWISNKLGRH